MPIVRLTLCLFALVVSTTYAAGPPRVAVSFRDDIHPLLVSRCLRCHQGSNPTSGVRLDARSEWLGESNGRPLVTPGKGKDSRLIHVVQGKVEDRVMPPEGRGKRLTPAEIDRLIAWIDQGLPWDEKVLPPPALPKHWAFQPIAKPRVPTLSHPRVRNPIDAFLAAKWKEQGLLPVDEVSRRGLIRRLTLDLTGLPPSVEEIVAFEKDRSPNAVEKLVDRLLASPRYGERQARFWLDLARYADSEGYESNHPRPHAWRYRDWVINAFNRDLDYPSFIRAQIAGDEIRPYRDEHLIATGFLASARHSSNEEDKARQRNDILVDIVNTTASSFLGLTMHCSQCHNHKFDPLTARDYYRFQAFFVRGQPANLALQNPLLHKRHREQVPAGYFEAKQRQQALFTQSKQRLIDKAKSTLTDTERVSLQLSPDQRSLTQERIARQAELKLQFAIGRIEREMPAPLQSEYADLKKKIADWEKTVPDVPQIFGYYAPATASAKVEILPMKGFYPLPFDTQYVSRLRSYLVRGGDVNQFVAPVEPGWPAVLGPTPKVLSPTPRLALANWLADRRNPLVARVWVNRLWQWHFGRGLTATSSDFGVRGAKPSHPELLDWLADEFLTSGGSTKHIHRLIVLSSAYRLASTPHAGNADVDPENVYLWRWMPRRLEAEVVRDAMLTVAGDLSAVMGGAPVTDETTSPRRGLYLLQKRDHPPLVQGLFDGPVASAESCPQRMVSTVPLQALYLLNNRFVRDRADRLARQVREVSTERSTQVRTLFQRILGRYPDEAEQQAVGRFLTRVQGEEALRSLAQMLLSTNEFIYLE